MNKTKLAQGKALNILTVFIGEITHNCFTFDRRVPFVFIAVQQCLIERHPLDVCKLFCGTKLKSIITMSATFVEIYSVFVDANLSQNT